MKLTRRQEEFVNKLIDLTTDLRGPIHYSMLAEQLGVSPFTAYDMLCVLEEKGIVTSEYQLAEGKSGPGRAERLFCPVMAQDDKRHKLQEHFDKANLDEAGLQQFIMDKIQNGDIPKMGIALDFISSIPPEGPGPTDYCLEVMTVIALRLHEQAGQNALQIYLPQILPLDETDCRANLTLFGGFSYGIMVQNGVADQEWSQMLFEHIQYFQELVQQMTPEQSVHLANAILSVFEILAKNKHEMVPIA